MNRPCWSSHRGRLASLGRNQPGSDAKAKRGGDLQPPTQHNRLLCSLRGLRVSAFQIEPNCRGEPAQRRQNTSERRTSALRIDLFPPEWATGLLLTLLKHRGTENHRAAVGRDQRRGVAGVDDGRYLPRRREGHEEADLQRVLRGKNLAQKNKKAQTCTTECGPPWETTQRFPALAETRRRSSHNLMQYSAADIG